ncbi:phosphodiester glycosidase family protein [Myxacorys almedinensis A]|uniref:Phosphodiester glycosidase family protein n=2 Tax=Myxacorys TaxID=2056239 RepID=A0A8J7YWF5_9CYAN|nr:phosphodiester glycosidase family protein [Myxacorys almedinensis]NDJ15869.1 phosphodiester glycosidase family protein [Myxacorys almedinensis A]
MVRAWLPSVAFLSRSVEIQTPVVPVKPPQYRLYKLPQSDVYTLTIAAASPSKIQVFVSKSTQTVGEFAEQSGAIAVINAGFFDPVNQKSTSYITIDGTLMADPRQNERLTQNPKLQPYLNQIFNRTEFQRYQCGQSVRYAIRARRSSGGLSPSLNPMPSACQLVDAVGGGPRLLPTLTASDEGFVDAATGRDAIAINQPNARSAVGITHDGSIIFVMAAQKPDAPKTSGLSLAQLADFMKEQGTVQAMNLDGGSSSALVYQGNAYYGKVNENGNPIKRPVKSVLMVTN